MLSEKQKVLLSHFADSANLYQSRIHCGVQISEFNEWLQDKNFADAYRKVKTHALSLLNDESNMLARNYVASILKQGSVKTVKTKTTDDTTVYEEIESFIPPKYIELGLIQNSIENAISTLASEGLLPDIVARKLIAQVNSNRNEIKKAFEISDDSKISDRKVMAIIKQALGLQQAKENE